MKRSLAELETIVRDRICRVCADRNADGGCGLEDPGSCALFRLFPRVVEAIQSTEARTSETIFAPSARGCARFARTGPRMALARCANRYGVPLMQDAGTGSRRAHAAASCW